MKQQELKDIKRQLLQISKEISERYQSYDEDAEAICSQLNSTICVLANRIELKYTK